MKRIFSIIAVLFLLSGLAACDRVPSGHVGVKVEKYGDSRGVNTQVLTPGTYFNGPNVDVFLFPLFTQTDKWQKSSDKDSPDQSITFQAAGGVSVNADIGISYHIEQSDVPAVFQKYRRGIEEISDSFIRNMVRDELNNRGIAFDVEALQAAGKQKLLADVEAEVQKQAKLNGITVESLSYLSDLRFPPAVVNAINAKIQATQEAMKVENEVRRTKAEAEKQIVTAQAQVQVAEAEAKAIEARGRALQANSNVLQLRALEIQAEAVKKWNGQLPQVNGQATPFITLK